MLNLISKKQQNQPPPKTLALNLLRLIIHQLTHQLLITDIRDYIGRDRFFMSTDIAMRELAGI